jgi:hypothetical protein
VITLDAARTQAIREFCQSSIDFDKGKAGNGLTNRAWFETYPVNDGNVLPDEPGWLPPGTVVIR